MEKYEQYMGGKASIPLQQFGFDENAAKPVGGMNPAFALKGALPKPASRTGSQGGGMRPSKLGGANAGYARREQAPGGMVATGAGLQIGGAAVAFSETKDQAIKRNIELSK